MTSFEKHLKLFLKSGHNHLTVGVALQVLLLGQVDAVSQSTTLAVRVHPTL